MTTIEAVLAGEARWCVVVADCTEVLRSLPDAAVDHVITDPPYDARTHRGALTGDAEPGEFGVGFAALDDAASVARELVRVARRWALAFCTLEQIAQYADGAGEAWVRAGIWLRSRRAPQISGDRPGTGCEGIAVMHRRGRKRWNGGGRAGVWTHVPATGDDRPDHPTPKPVALMLELVRDFSDRGEVILDPYAGSGTTGEAALRSGRRVIMVERNAEYARIAEARARAAESHTTARADGDGQRALFGESR